jgi:TonB family protein
MTEAWKRLEGQVVNREFHLRQYLAGSNHSAVFLTEYADRKVSKAAIKLIRAEPATAELQRARWRLAAKLSHPHLLRLYEMGRCQLDKTGFLYVVMEYAEEDLSEILPQRPLTPAEARDMLKSALEVLTYVHRRGFAHGRLKPANIMAIGDQIKLSSDGLCPVGESTGSRAKPSPYDPPEAASGRVSPAGDVWSLGMTLVEALTQHLPVWERTEQGEPVLPESLPEPFLDVARGCLRREPWRRWKIADIATRLRLSLSPPPRRAMARPREAFAKRRYVIPALAVGLAVIVMLAGPRLLHLHREARRAPSTATEQRKPQSKHRLRSETPEAVQSAQKAGDKEQSASSSAPSPTSLRSEAATTSAGSPAQGKVLQQVLPDVPQKARDTIHGTVRVRVRVTVDPSGNVAEATFDSPGPSKYFANLAMEAARRWAFEPPKVEGWSVPSEWVLRFEFTRTVTKAVPTQTAPQRGAG